MLARQNKRPTYLIKLIENILKQQIDSLIPYNMYIYIYIYLYIAKGGILLEKTHNTISYINICSLAKY